MENFWNFSVWGTFNIIAILLLSLLFANIVKNSLKFLRASLIPTSVLAGAFLLIISAIYKWITGDVMFNTEFFGGKGMATLETITYHALALGFIASTLRSTKNKITKQRTVEIFNTGVTTVSTYLLQAVVGFGITIIASLLIKNFFSAAGVLLPFGYGQGTGQALNYGNIYETDFGFIGGKSFGLTIAALGFLSASIGGVFHLNIMKKKNKIKTLDGDEGIVKDEAIQDSDEIPMQGSLDKITIQIALIAGAYLVTHIVMYILGLLLPGMRSVIYGFNFLLGVFSAVLMKGLFNFLHKTKVIKKKYANNFLLTRCSNFCFDIMVVSGIAAIQLGVLEKYWGIMLILGVVGLIITYIYNIIVAKTLFKDYSEEQFLMMYGMLTGTASTGVILLREIDGDFKTPASDNMVYQNFPAIVLGFPIMFLATLAPIKPYLTLIVLFAFFVVLNIVLFRSKIFKRKKKK